MSVTEAVKLGGLGYVTVGLTITWNSERKKKELRFASAGWQLAGLSTATDHPFVSASHNGLAIVTGKASNVLAIDADRLKPGEDSELADGLELLKRLEAEKGLPNDVVVAETGSGGRHYLFNYSKSIANGLRENVVGSSKLSLGDIRATVDSRINGNCLICCPSSYSTPEGTRSYRWLNGYPPASSELPAAPSWLIQDLNSTRVRPHPTGLPLSLSKPKRERTTDDTLIVRDSSFGTCQPLLHNIGFRDTRLTRLKPDGFDFVADRSCCCPLCSLQHDSQEWFSIRLCEGCFEVRSYSTRCRSKLLGLEGQKQLLDIFLTPACDEPYVAIFASHFGLGKNDTPVIWTGQRWLQYQGHLWKPIEVLAVRALLVDMCVRLMDRLARLQRSMETDADLLKDEGAAGRAKERYRALLKGISYIKRGGNQRNMMDCLKASLFLNVGEDPSGIVGRYEMDSDPYLLGCENGVIDLKTCRLRDGRPDDWMSKSIGYAYNPSETGRSFVEDSMQKTFPVAEEREFVQRYAGYCLLGKHPEKKYMLVTDMAGRKSGSNGKTTVNQGLRHALGEYACQGIAETLYTDGSTRNENSCTPGRMHYRGKRLATYEELDPKKKFDTTRLKNLHGGCATETARDAYGRSVEEFPWTAKFLISFNISELPDVSLSRSSQ